jgi:hypothetical protein
MPSLNYTVEEVVSEVRQQLDEQNRDSVDDSLDILPTLNRAQIYAFDILARRYPEPILQHTVLTLTGGTQEYTIPEGVFEDRVLKLEIEIPSGGSGSSTYHEIQRISYRDISNYESSSTTPVPEYYCIVGRKIRLIGTPNGSYSARMWSLRNPEKLVLPQGRITIVNSASNYVILDSTGSSLTTVTDSLGSYVNVVDGQTGEIRGSLQIQILANNKVTFRSSPTRTTVLNRPITGDLDTVEVSQDDYLAPIEGTCVPYFGQPTTNFLIQFAVAELTRKLGGESEKEEAILDKFEKQVGRTWAGREVSLRIRKRSQKWGTPIRRRDWE